MVSLYRAEMYIGDSAQRNGLLTLAGIFIGYVVAGDAQHVALALSCARVTVRRTSCTTQSHHADRRMTSSLYYIIVKKTSQFKTVCKDDSGYITQLKQQKSKKVILLKGDMQ